MSLENIVASAAEIRRLAIAGSGLAVGDFRLKKLISPLEQAGAKVPVFAQVAKALTELVNGKEADSASNLLSLSTLLNAILYTQGSSGSTGDFGELETIATNSSATPTPARVLKPLTDALTTTGSGRFETVKTAFESGLFRDFRLVRPTIQALGDAYPELADFVAKKVLPGYGPGILSLLRSSFEPQGSAEHGRRLKLMHRLDPAGTIPACKSALEEGSVEVKIAAIECLGKHVDCLPLVQEQANSKNKQIRAAALEALAPHGGPEIAKLFSEILGGKSLDILAQPFRNVTDRQVLERMLTELQRVHQELLAGNSELLPRFSDLLDCIESRPEFGEFLLGCFKQSELLIKLKSAKNTTFSGRDLVSRLAELLHNEGSPASLEAIIEKYNTVPDIDFGLVFQSALQAWKPEKVFEQFSPLLQQTKGAGKKKNESLQDALSTLVNRQRRQDDKEDNEEEPEEGDGKALELGPWTKVQLDPRWLDAAIQADQPHAVCCLARPNHPKAVEYILKIAEAKKEFDFSTIVDALSQCHYPKVSEYFLTLVSKKCRGDKAHSYETHYLFECIQRLPKEDLPKLEGYASQVPEKYSAAYLQALESLRAQVQAKS